MSETTKAPSPSLPLLFKPLTLPCGVILKNRIVKSAMSDSLGDGTGHPSEDQCTLYKRWANGGLAAAIVGEVQSSPDYAEKPGNLVLNAANHARTIIIDTDDNDRFVKLAQAGSTNGAFLWLQLGHAGALSYAPTSKQLKGPSALDLPDLKCDELTLAEIEELPSMFADTAKLAQDIGFGGVQIHAAHGFLLSQFLSPLFNKRTDGYGGSITNRMKLLLEVIDAVRSKVGPTFPIAVKLNSSDMLEGGLVSEDALEVVKALDQTSIDVLDISGGTYFPGAKAASDGSGKGPYFLAFAQEARKLTSKPLMLTGGFKTRDQAESALAVGVDLVGLARALIIAPNLPREWEAGENSNPKFPRFPVAPEGGVTAWYTMKMSDVVSGKDELHQNDIESAIEKYEQRDKMRTEKWIEHFSSL